MVMPSVSCIPLISYYGLNKGRYSLDEQGKLQHWHFDRGTWIMMADNLFQVALRGFDGAADEQGLQHLLGYDNKGNIYYLDPSNSEDKPKLIYAGQNQNISQLSCCFDHSKQLHVFFLRTVALNMPQLFYLYGKGQEWQKPIFIDNVCGTARPYCTVLCDQSNQVYMLYPIVDGERQRLSFRMINSSDHPGRIYLLPGRGDNWPSYLCDVENNLHITWINNSEKHACLNFIQRDKRGEWRNYLGTPVPLQTLPTAPLTSRRSELFIYYQWGRKLSMLYSRDGGKGWNKGKDENIKQNDTLSRFKLIFPSSDGLKRGYAFFYFYSDIFLNNTRDSLGLLRGHQAISAKDAERLLALKDPEINNEKLAEKIRTKEKELIELRLREKLRIEEFEKIVAAKTKKLHNTEAQVENVQIQLKLLKDERGIFQEKIDLLRADVVKLQDNKEKLLKIINERDEAVKEFEVNKPKKYKKTIGYFLRSLLSIVKH